MTVAKKNANGEGTIFKRIRNGKTTWYAELIIGQDAEGKRKVLRESGDTRAKVKEWLDKQVEDRRKGTLVEPSKELLDDFVTKWLAETVVHEVGTSTIRMYTSMYTWYAKGSLGATPIQKLRPQDIQGLYHRMITEGKSPRSVQMLHTVLRRALKQAAEWGVISSNPADKVKPPRVERKEIEPLSPDQIRAFMGALEEERLRALFVLAITTGLRRGELLGLRWQDVDMDGGTLTVAQTMKPLGKNGWTFGPTKTKSSRRTLDLPEIALHYLRRWKKDQLAEREEALKKGAQWEHPELVFTTRLGGLINPHNLRNRSFQSVLERAGLPHFRFHDLRHTAATLMLIQGVTPKVLQELLGHSQIQVTMDVYGHVVREQKKEAARAVDNFFKAEPKTKRKAK